MVREILCIPDGTEAGQSFVPARRTISDEAENPKLCCGGTRINVEKTWDISFILILTRMSPPCIVIYQGSTYILHRRVFWPGTEGTG